MNHIPKVRDWKVTDKNTGRYVIVSTINKRFARWEASDLGINGNVTVSLFRFKPPAVRHADRVTYQW